MISEMRALREQLDAFRQRAESAESERDVGRERPADMVRQIQQRDEEERKREEERRSRSRSSPTRSRPRSRGKSPDESHASTNGGVPEPSLEADQASDGVTEEEPTLSRANTITPSRGPSTKQPQDQALVQTLPYASMIGVVLLGMGLMAYLNGWQPQPKLDR